MAKQETHIERRGRGTSYDIVAGLSGKRSGSFRSFNRERAVMLPVYAVSITESRYNSCHWIRHVNYHYAALEFILEGRVKYTNSKGTFEAGPGDVFFISHNSNCHYTKAPDCKEIHKVYAIISGSLLGVFLKELGLGEDHLFHPERFYELLEELSTICRLFEKNDDTASDFAAAGKMCALLYRFAGMYHEEKSSGRPGASALEELSENMRNYIDQPLSNRELAAALHVGKTTSHKKFLEKYGVPPHRYMRQLRLERAKELLQTTPLSVSAVAEECGFSNLQYFITLFRKTFGISPGKFKSEKSPSFLLE